VTSPHAPRPGDLVALVSFDGDVYANQAVTRDRMGRPALAPHALGAAIEQWLGRRPVWIDVRGRQIRGIATARELAGRDAWEIDTLVDATNGSGEVVVGLLRQATEAAAEAGATRLLLRVASDSPAAAEARRAGFAPAIEECLWTRGQRADTVPGVPAQVREADPEADAFLEFQLYSRAMPVHARQTLGMGFDEWAAAQERRWLPRGARALMAFADDRAGAVLRTNGEQLTVLADAEHSGCAEALLARAEGSLDARAFALQPECAATPVGALRDHGFEPGPTYSLLVLRTMRPLPVEARESIRARTVVPRGG
jgi:hypothetical protein